MVIGVQSDRPREQVATLGNITTLHVGQRQHLHQLRILRRKLLPTRQQVERLVGAIQANQHRPEQTARRQEVWHPRDVRLQQLFGLWVFTQSIMHFSQQHQAFHVAGSRMQGCSQGVLGLSELPAAERELGPE